jgi:hypothetical protein
MRLTAADDANRDLPPAVRARITALQDQSEKLIGWIQLAIAILFGVLYGLSRQTVPMGTAIWLLTPAAIGLYFIATVIRLVMAYRIRMGFWLLAGSIAIRRSSRTSRFCALFGGSLPEPPSPTPM